MTQTELTQALSKFAKADLRAARKNGEMMVCQTKCGNVTITHEEGVYTLSTFNLKAMASETLAQGKPATVLPVLMNLYVVVEA